MTLNKLASAIAKREGKKHQASIGDIREVIKIIVDMEAVDLVENPYNENGILALFSAMVNKRAAELYKKKKKAKKK